MQDNTTYLEDIRSLEGRIAIAETARDAWQSAGSQEKYMEAYSMVEALEHQLAARRRLHKAATAGGSSPQASAPA